MNHFFAFVSITFKHIRYEIIYYLLGFWGVYEDIVYRKRNKCDPVKKTGEVAIITGGARGIGAVMVKKLLECDMHVVVACRNVDAGNRLIAEIRDSGVTTGSSSIIHIDMNSLESIKNFADVFLKENNRLHLLINNAGIMFPPYTETADGFESQWGVNYVGHFYLTHLLMNRLVETGSSSVMNTRIVNVSSCAHIASYPIDFDDVNMKSCYIPSAAYAQSKLAQLMFTKTLDRLVNERGYNVRVIAVHPGVVDTDIFNGTFVKRLFPWVMKAFFKTPEQGAMPILYASVSPKLNNEGGLYISNCRVSSVSKIVDDPLQQEQLFSYSLSSVNIRQFFITAN